MVDIYHRLENSGLAALHLGSQQTLWLYQSPMMETLQQEYLMVPIPDFGLLGQFTNLVIFTAYNQKYLDHIKNGKNK